MNAERLSSRAVRMRARGGVALASALSLTVCGCAVAVADGAAPPAARDAMFRGGPGHEGRYAPLVGRTLAGVQWRFMTEGDVVSTPVVSGSIVYVGSGD